MICTLLNFDSSFSGASEDDGSDGSGGSEPIVAMSGSCK
jgi:hypothetical protein